MPPPLFDEKLVQQHLDRAQGNLSAHDVLFNEAAQALSDRLADVNRSFISVRDLSPFPFLKETAPLEESHYDLIVSNLALHWVNALSETLASIRALLKPEGLFLGSLIGGESLKELRACLMEAELSVTGGVSPRISPMIDLSSASRLMQHAGFHLPVVDSDSLTLTYPDLFALMRDLRGMGQSNALTERLRRPTPRAVFLEADRLYRARFCNSSGRISARFDIVYLHGWG